jgi:hypothetical protein
MTNKLIPAALAGAATIAALALFSGTHPGESPTVAAGPSSAHIITVDDGDGNVNDNGQTSGDIFTQNAQDQSTA